MFWVLRLARGERDGNVGKEWALLSSVRPVKGGLFQFSLEKRGRVSETTCGSVSGLVQT